MHFEPKPGIVTPRLLRTKAAAAYLGASSWKIRRLVADGQLPFVSNGERTGWWFDIRDLDRYIEANKRSY